MQSKEYPRWLHSPTENSVLVVDAEEEAELGSGWYESLAEAKSVKNDSSRIEQIEAEAKKRGRPRKDQGV